MLLMSIIGKTLGIKNHVVKKIEQGEDGFIIHLDLRRRRRLRCGPCGASGRVRDRLKTRKWKHVPLGGIPVTLVYAPARVTCPDCGKVRVESIPWSQGIGRLSIGLIWLLSAWCRLLTWDVVAKLFQVHWNTVAAAVRSAMDYGLKHREFGEILCIGIDELSRRNGHVYVTNVSDLNERRLIWSGEGRSKETLRRFFAEHGDTLKNKVKAVCCDMWQPYIDVIKEQLPNATLVFDKFHIIRHLLQAVDEVRWDEARELKKTNPELLKRTRYLWLKNALEPHGEGTEALRLLGEVESFRRCRGLWRTSAATVLTC